MTHFLDIRFTHDFSHKSCHFDHRMQMTLYAYLESNYLCKEISDDDDDDERGGAHAYFYEKNSILTNDTLNINGNF